MDAVDLRILAEVQLDGRASMSGLARRIGLTTSRCHRRLRDLQTTGAIRGFHADVDRSMLGLEFEALLLVVLRDVTAAAARSFEDAARAIPPVTQVQRVLGGSDYLLRVVTADLPAFQGLLDDELTSLPGAAQVTTLVVARTVLDRPPPVPTGWPAPKRGHPVAPVSSEMVESRPN